MIRYVISAVLAVALVGASLPAVENAAAERTASRLDRVGTDIERAAASLRTGSDPVAADVGGARRTLTFSLPRGSLTAAPVRFLALCRSTAGRAVLGYAVGTQPPVTRRLATSLRVRGGGIRFTEPGVHTLVLEYHATRSGAVVTVGVAAAVGAREGSSRGTRPTAACDSWTASGRTTPRGAGASRPSGPWGTRATRT